MGNRQPALILNSKAWNKITDREFNDTHVVLKKCKNVPWSKNGPMFKNATHLYVVECDAEFIFFWIDMLTFPNIKHIYVASERGHFHLRSAFPNATIYTEDTTKCDRATLWKRSNFPRFKQSFKFNTTQKRVHKKSLSGEGLSKVFE